MRERKRRRSAVRIPQPLRSPAAPDVGGLAGPASEPRRSRRARASRWTRRTLAIQSLATCFELFGECAELVALVRRELERADDLDAASRERMYAVVREMIHTEELGRVAILAALLAPTGRHDA